MGIKQSVSARYCEVGSFKSYHFGEVPVYEDKSNSKKLFCCCYDLLLQLDKAVERTSELQKANNNCENMLQIAKIDVEANGLCANTLLMKVYFQYVPITLRSHLDTRRRALSQNRAYLLLGCLLSAVSHLNSKQTYHGDICPEFIYLDNCDSTSFFLRVDGVVLSRFKLADPTYFLPDRTGYNRGQTKTIYCAPEVMINLWDRKAFPNFNRELCDVFSIGLVVLESITLISPLYIYKDETKTIDTYPITSLMRIALKKGYSQDLLECLNQCFADIAARPNAETLFAKYGHLFRDGSCKQSLRRSTSGSL